jgi:hypothetical protein
VQRPADIGTIEAHAAARRVRQLLYMRKFVVPTAQLPWMQQLEDCRVYESEMGESQAMPLAFEGEEAGEEADSEGIRRKRDGDRHFFGRCAEGVIVGMRSYRGGGRDGRGNENEAESRAINERHERSLRARLERLAFAKGPVAVAMGPRPALLKTNAGHVRSLVRALLQEEVIATRNVASADGEAAICAQAWGEGAVHNETEFFVLKQTSIEKFKTEDLLDLLVAKATGLSKSRGASPAVKKVLGKMRGGSDGVFEVLQTLSEAHKAGLWVFNLQDYGPFGGSNGDTSQALKLACYAQQQTSGPKKGGGRGKGRDGATGKGNQGRGAGGNNTGRGKGRGGGGKQGGKGRGRGKGRN